MEILEEKINFEVTKAFTFPKLMIMSSLSERFASKNDFNLSFYTNNYHFSFLSRARITLSLELKKSDYLQNLFLTVITPQCINIILIITA